MKPFDQKALMRELADALLLEGIPARPWLSYGFVSWKDDEDRPHQAWFGAYGGHPLLARLVWVIGEPGGKLSRLCYTDVDRASEITFVPTEIHLLARNIARLVKKGQRARPYLWTPAAWTINPFHDPTLSDDEFRWGWL